MRKLLLVAAPLVLYSVAYFVRAALGRRPSRHALNVELAVLLALYFFATAGLGLFWVANQQLPPFDLHYLFGYGTFALVVAHIFLNARIVWAYVRRGPRPAKEDIGRRFVALVVGALAIAGASFFLGMRAGSPRLPSSFSGAGNASLAAVEQYHAMSSHSREGVVLRAPSVAWELPVERYIDRDGLPVLRLGTPDPARGTERSIDDALAPRTRGAGGRPTKEDLSVLLWATSGITDRRGGHDLRASASSGALFPSELYVLAWDVEGLAPGTYAYGPAEHVLFDLGKPLPEHPATGLTLDGAKPPPLALVMTSVFRRTGQKYRDRAYRYAVADAGHAVGNALVAAADLGLSPEVVQSFDERVVAAAIGVDDVTEGVLAVISMRTDGARATASDDGLFSSAPLVDPDTLELGATGLAHLSTSLQWRANDAADTVALAAGQPPVTRALELIGKRRSIRTFERGTLGLGDIAGVLRAAAGPTPLVSRAVRAHLVATRIDGLGAGTHRFDATAFSLRPGRAGELGRTAGRAALDQEVVGDAPAAIVLTIDRGVLAAEGPRGYRHAFLEAGIIGARLYLATAAYGLGGCSVGAFYDAEAAELLGIDLEAEWPIHFFAFGKPG